MLPVISLTVTVILLVLYYMLSPAFSFIYIGGSLEIPNLTYTSDLMHPKSHTFILQAEAVQNCFPELYGSSALGNYYLTSVITAFSEGKSGLRAYYWSTFWAPQDMVLSIQNLSSTKQKQILSKRLPPTDNSTAEAYSWEEDFDVITMELFVSDSMDYDVTLKAVLALKLNLKDSVSKRNISSSRVMEMNRVAQDHLCTPMQLIFIPRPLLQKKSIAL
ncbi:uncharacterized protein LOC117045092 [Lacerta agilis]|uniref:uncharacterized protein LOC117045092 n=1 Tax=Lacerta agilis TaxID=80427 RepID=UPI0014196172|nr:uncharacterized protein LOC117045092 [Lacerta agilis]